MYSPGGRNGPPLARVPHSRQTSNVTAPEVRDTERDAEWLMVRFPEQVNRQSRAVRLVIGGAREHSGDGGENTGATQVMPTTFRASATCGGGRAGKQPANGGEPYASHRRG